MTHVPTVILSRTSAALAGMGKRVEVPKSLGSVTLIRPLGEGGMSVVYLGRHELLHTNVAVKFLLDMPGSEEDPRFTAFVEGARAAAAIRHPGLNIVHHADAAGGIPYLVMELIEGPTLAEVIKERGPLPPNIARAVVESACRAVAELHAHEMIHRDIKPANIMIDPTGRVVVTDFGLTMSRPAALFGGPAGGVAGTPAYMAPEMFAGNVSTRTDVYALGATIFEILTGRPPFDGDFQGLQLAHRTSAFPVGALAGAGAPEDVIVAIERAMHKDALYRPKSAGHVLDAYSKACESSGVTLASPAQIQRFIEVGAASESGPRSASATPTPAYYERLNTLAEFKRRTPEGTMFPEHESGAPAAAALTAATPAEAERADGDSAVSPQGSPRVSLPPWRVAGVLSLVTGLVLAVLAPAGRWLWLKAVLAAESLHLIRPVPEMEIDMGSRVIHGQLPRWYEISVDGLIVMACVAAPLLACWRAYQALVLQRPRADGVTRCGWCGHGLSGLADPRCPECGHLIGAVAKRRGDQMRPPSDRLANRARRYGAAALAFACFEVFALPLYLRAFGPDTPGLSIVWVLRLWPVFLVGVLVSLVALHFVARSTAFLTGRTYCGRCAAELRNLQTPQCKSCGVRL